MESLKERIKELCKNKGISLNKLEMDCGVAKGYISKMDKSAPSANTIQKIAEYLNVSIDFLLKGEDEFGYYYDPETAQIAQEIFDDKDLHALFDAARGSSPEDLKMAAEMLRKFKATNPDG